MDHQQIMAKVRDQNKKFSEQRIESESKERLKSICRKKFETCFISAIAEFEQTFGEELWGHNLAEEQLTNVQKQNREKWQKVRNTILNKGNTQARAVQSEIDLHKVRFVGYQMNLVGGTASGK